MKFKFIKNLFLKKPTKQSIAVVKYPHKILIETIHTIKNSYSIRSAEVTVLNPDASDFEVGEAVVKHLELSKDNIKMPSDTAWKEIKEKYKKITVLKSIKAQMKDSQYVHIKRENSKIEFIPSVNGGTSGSNKGFQHLPEKSLAIENTNDFIAIGKTVNLALERCR